MAAFGAAWYMGWLQRIVVYVEETKEELRRCSWPSWEELKGSTLVVFICMAIIGIFTFVVDFVFAALVRNLT